ncbi:hypothetical protein J7643_14875 [bacterium]|nr:hypothetical protein [bacterium]
MRRRVVALGLAALLWGVQAACLKQLGAAQSAGISRLTVPNPQLVKLAVSDFDNLTADLLWMQVIVHNGEQLVADGDAMRDFSGMYEALDLVTDLDSRFREAAIFGSWMLSDAGKVDEARRLLVKSMHQHPSEWIYPYQLGFVEFLYARRYIEAAEYFSRAASLPDGPAGAARMAAGMYAKGNKTDLAIASWRNIHAKGDARVRGFARRALAKLGVSVDP